MGLTGANGFPCCGKGAVDIVEIQNDFNHRRPQPHLTEEEDDLKEEAELLEQEPLPKGDLDASLDTVPDLEDNPEMEPELYRVPKPESQPDAEAPWKVTTVECCCESTNPQTYRIESLQPYAEELPTPQNLRQWSGKSTTSLQSITEKDPDHRSIHVQTSKHLFWADKLIQASEHSLQQALRMQCTERSKKAPGCPKHEAIPRATLCPQKQLQISTAHTVFPSPSAQPTPSPCLSTSSLPQAIGLADLINFASSLAIASSTDIELPSLENMIRAPPQKPVEPSAEPVKPSTVPVQPAADKQKLVEKPPNAQEPEKKLDQEDKQFPCSYLDFSRPGIKRATIEGELKFLQTQTLSPQSQEAKEEQQKAADQEIPIHKEKASAEAWKTACKRSRRGSVQQDAEREAAAAYCPNAPAGATSSRSHKDSADYAAAGAKACPTSSPWGSLTDENLLPLTPRQLAAFQDIFKLFSCSPTGTVDMRSMKVALRNVGMQLGPQEMCEALRLADLDGDGIVSFKDFLGVLTDSHCLAQCMRQVRNRRVCDPRSLQTLFIEMLFKLLSQGFVPSKSAQEVMSYYFKKQGALQLSPGCRGRARGQVRASRIHAGLNFFCQAARVSGLSSTELARSLHALYKAGARSPYSQIPKLAGRTRPEHRSRSRVPGPVVPKSHQSGLSKLPPNLGPLCSGFLDESLEQMRLSKRAPSPATLVQKQPLSPLPASLQRQTTRSLYK